MTTLWFISLMKLNCLTNCSFLLFPENFIQKLYIFGWEFVGKFVFFRDSVQNSDKLNEIPKNDNNKESSRFSNSLFSIFIGLIPFLNQKLTICRDVFQWIFFHFVFSVGMLVVQKLSKSLISTYLVIQTHHSPSLQSWFRPSSIKVSIDPLFSRGKTLWWKSDSF